MSSEDQPAHFTSSLDGVSTPCPMTSKEVHRPSVRSHSGLGRSRMSFSSPNIISSNTPEISLSLGGDTHQPECPRSPPRGNFSRIEVVPHTHKVSSRLFSLVGLRQQTKFYTVTTSGNASIASNSTSTAARQPVSSSSLPDILAPSPRLRHMAHSSNHLPQSPEVPRKPLHETFVPSYYKIRRAAGGDNGGSDAGHDFAAASGPLTDTVVASNYGNKDGTSTVAATTAVDSDTSSLFSLQSDGEEDNSAVEGVGGCRVFPSLAPMDAVRSAILLPTAAPARVQQGTTVYGDKGQDPLQEFQHPLSIGGVRKDAEDAQQQTASTMAVSPSTQSSFVDAATTLTADSLGLRSASGGAVNGTAAATNRTSRTASSTLFNCSFDSRGLRDAGSEIERTKYQTIIKKTEQQGVSLEDADTEAVDELAEYISHHVQHTQQSRTAVAWFRGSRSASAGGATTLDNVGDSVVASNDSDCDSGTTSRLANSMNRVSVLIAAGGGGGGGRQRSVLWTPFEYHEDMPHSPTNPFLSQDTSMPSIYCGSRLGKDNCNSTSASGYDYSPCYSNAPTEASHTGSSSRLMAGHGSLSVRVLQQPAVAPPSVMVPAAMSTSAMGRLGSPLPNPLSLYSNLPTERSHGSFSFSSGAATPTTSIGSSATSSGNPVHSVAVPSNVRGTETASLPANRNFSSGNIPESSPYAGYPIALVSSRPEHPLNLPEDDEQSDWDAPLKTAMPRTASLVRRVPSTSSSAGSSQVGRTAIISETVPHREQLARRAQEDYELYTAIIKGRLKLDVAISTQ